MRPRTNEARGLMKSALKNLKIEEISASSVGHRLVKDLAFSYMVCKRKKNINSIIGKKAHTVSVNVFLVILLFYSGLVSPSSVVSTFTA